MSRWGKTEGTCHLCLREGELSFEHVPPKKAYNNGRLVALQWHERLAMDEEKARRGRIVQGGSGGYTLCPRCNNSTGAWYGREYVEWVARVGLPLLDRLPPGGPYRIVIRQRYPLRFLKQVVSMILSTNGPEFTRRNPDLPRFVLDPKRRGLDPRYEVYMTLVGGSEQRNIGVFSRLNVETGRLVVASEVSYPPFAFLMSFDGHHVEGPGRISHFATVRHEERREVAVELLRGEIATSLPGDYRTRSELDGHRRRRGES